MQYQKTIRACFVGYIVQAVVNNFVPLLFVHMQAQYGIPLSKITFLITLNFGLQLLVDLASAFFVDKIGYRKSVVLAHAMAVIGLIALAVLPEIFSDPFLGLLISVAFYAVGGGLLEVVVSPMVEACPTEHKDKTMSLLHSSYCWGTVAVVLISTVYFAIFGIAQWRILSVLWAVLPVVNGLLFLRVPIAELEGGEADGGSLSGLFRNKIFWLFIVVMCCAGASEQAVIQWASAFAEQALGISKAVGDLAGPTVFSVLMGLSRWIYGTYGEKLKLERVMLVSGVLCVAAYLMISLTESPLAGLAGIAVSGFAVGIMWPGAYSMASASIRGGGTAMFAILALAGDLGCTGGPTFAGRIAAASGNNLKIGILASILFPALLSAVMLFLQKKKKV